MARRKLHDDEIQALIDALRRLAVADEMAGMGDVADAEGLARIDYARRKLAELGLSHKQSRRGQP